MAPPMAASRAPEKDGLFAAEAVGRPGRQEGAKESTTGVDAVHGAGNFVRVAALVYVKVFTILFVCQR
jgi:hypothetical protein